MRRYLLLVLVGFLSCALVSAKTIGLSCWIVAEDDGDSQHSPSTITNCVIELNRIFSQVAMEFSLVSIVKTNSSHLANIVFTNSAHIAELCSIASQTGGLEVYFVESITGGVNAFCGTSGIAVSSTHNRTTLAHEVGHACGLDDVYDWHRETTLVVTGMPTEERLPHDWGWYPPAVSQADIVRRLLMYGYDTSDKGDISAGDVYGLYYESEWNAGRGVWERVWRLGNAPVGFGTHGSRHPASR